MLTVLFPSGVVDTASVLLSDVMFDDGIVSDVMFDEVILAPPVSIVSLDVELLLAGAFVVVVSLAGDVMFGEVIFEPPASIVPLDVELLLAVAFMDVVSLVALRFLSIESTKPMFLWASATGNGVAVTAIEVVIFMDVCAAGISRKYPPS